jgi:hypothetical protein
MAQVFKAHHVDVLATDHEVLVKEHARLTHELLASTDMADPAMVCAAPSLLTRRRLG